MVNKKISDLTELTTPVTGDLLEIVDISDTTDAVTGSNKKITYSNFQGNLSITESQISDFGTYLENVVEDTTPNLGGRLNLNGNNIIIVPSSVSGLSSGDSARWDGTNWVQTDASVESTAKGLWGIYDGTNIIIYGPYTTTGLTATDEYYMSETAGAITNTAPTTSLSIVRSIGKALSTTVLFVKPSTTYIEVA